ncbi:MAG TPA: SBBP repeat-containing protein [Bryobacteraceae bacterium]|nr:SBBP repeat-containing protein [Bryobacteraceae bacterium]
MPFLKRWASQNVELLSPLMLKLLVICALAPACCEAAVPAIIAHLPNTSIVAVKTDAAGNLYIAGYKGSSTQRDSQDAFVSKLSPDGSKVFYSTILAGSKSDSVGALDIDSTGAAYLWGQTDSSDFPVTPGALQTNWEAPSTQGFVAKVDAQGKVVFATLIGDTSDVYPVSGGLVVDSAGEAIISGQAIGANLFPSAPGAPYRSTAMNTFFVLKLDAGGARILGAIRGLGGRVALDGPGNIYLAGTAEALGPLNLPVTPGAFQSTHALNFCGGTGQLAFACLYQYVTKFDASLTRIVYATYVSGSFGAVPAALAVDSNGNALLAGTTNSPDYPTTAGAFQPVYVAAAPTPPSTCLFGCFFPPPSSGYITELNAGGTGLVASTFFSGTQTDTIAFAALTPGGVYISGNAGSSDLPGLAGVPPQCLTLPATYQTKLSPDLSAVSAAHLLSGSILAYDPSSGTLPVWNGTDLAQIDPEAAAPPIACVLDAADLRPVTTIAPGELLSVFGAHFVNLTLGQTPGVFPTTLSGLTVAFNGIPGPLLYVSPRQINVQAPYEIAGQTQVQLTLTTSQPDAADSVPLAVAARNPVAFLDTVTPPQSVSFPNCNLSGLIYSGGPLPLAFNSDGSRNTCFSPAPAGSVVRIFLSGLGLTVPAPVTGAPSPAPGVPLNLPITFTNGFSASVVSAIALPGAISGVWQVDIRMPEGQHGAIPIPLFVDSVPLRDTNLTVWMR